MKLKLCMVQHNALPQNVIKLDEDAYTEDIRRDDDDGRKFFTSRTHFRHNGKFFNPAFEMEFELGENPATYTLAYSPDSEGGELTNFRRHKNIFYDVANGNKDFALGATNPGVTYIYVLKNSVIQGEPRRLVVFPASMTLAEFEKMIHEIKLIRSELIQKSDGQGKSGLPQDLVDMCNTDDLKKFWEGLNQYVKELLAILQRIDRHPRFGLKKIQTPCKLEKIRKFDGKIIRQYLENPLRKKYFVDADEITYNIFENRLLLDKISKLSEFVVESSKSQKIKLTETRQNILGKMATLKNSYARLPDDRKLSVETSKYLEKSLEKVETDLETDSTVNEIISTLKKCLELNFFRAVERQHENWRMTQIFTNDANYHAAYLKLNHLNKVLDFSFTADKNAIIHEKLDMLYEYWVLAKIVEYLIVKLGWRSADGGDNPAEVLRNFFEVRNVRWKKDAHIFLAKKNLAMEIFYNTPVKFSLGSDSKLRPDYLFKIKVGTVPPKIFILDAKYRNYEEQGFFNGLRRDLSTVCIKKYIKDIEDATHLQVTTSFIVHTDKTPSLSSENADNVNTYWQEKDLGKYVIFNGTADKRSKSINKISDGSKKQFGAFYLLPNVAENDKIPNKSEDNLTVFFEMIFEYFLGQWKNFCWQCGSEDVDVEPHKTAGDYKKFYMRCNKCGSFWVKTHCHKIGCNIDLVKHFINYHVEEQAWFVTCPKCGS